MRLETYSERMIGEYQAGFRRGRSVRDQLFTVKSLEKFWEYYIDLHQISVNFKQADDSVEHCNAGDGNSKQADKAGEVNNDRKQAEVRIQGQLTEEFRVKQGIKQGDGLPPILFNLGPDYIITNLSVSTNSSLLYRLVHIV
jgi:hypothetical protein